MYLGFRKLSFKEARGSREGAYPQLHQILSYRQEQMVLFVTRQEEKCLHTVSAIFKAVVLMTGE